MHETIIRLRNAMYDERDYLGDAFGGCAYDEPFAPLWVALNFVVMDRRFADLERLIRGTVTEVAGESWSIGELDAIHFKAEIDAQELGFATESIVVSRQVFAAAVRRILAAFGLRFPQSTFSDSIQRVLLACDDLASAS